MPHFWNFLGNLIIKLSLIFRNALNAPFVFLKIIYLTVFSLRDKPIIPDRTISTILQVSRIEERNDSSLLLVPIIKKALNAPFVFFEDNLFNRFFAAG